MVKELERNTGQKLTILERIEIFDKSASNPNVQGLTTEQYKLKSREKNEIGDEKSFHKDLRA